MLNFFPSEKKQHSQNHVTEKATTNVSSSTRNTKDKKNDLSPGVGHSGMGASLPMLIVISQGRIRFLSFPIYKVNNAEIAVEVRVAKKKTISKCNVD